MKKILFIGGKGYLGSHLKENLEDFKIINPGKKKLDVLNKSHLYKYIKKDVDFIINLSGQVGSNSSKINILGNKNILYVLKKKMMSPILIFFSSTLVLNYKNNKLKKIKNIGPTSNYAKSKLISENFLKKNYQNNLILRLSNVYDNNFKRSSIFRNIINALEKNKPKFTASNIKTSRNFININDLAGHLNSLLKRSEKLKKNKIIYLINENLRINEIISFFEKKFSKKINVIDLKKNLTLDYSQKINIKSMEKTGYKNKFNIKKTLKKYYVQ